MHRHASWIVVAFATVSIVGTALAGDRAVDAGPALHGYCPVAYVAMEQAVEGDPSIALEYRGHRYLFANAMAKDMFAADPGKYAVAYGGWCATAATMNQHIESNPTLFASKDGVTYLFSSTDAKKMFEAEPAGYAYDPAYDGWCATAMSMGKTVDADPAIFTVADGVAYLFSTEEAKTRFDADAKEIRAKADAHWKKQKNS